MACGSNRPIAVDLFAGAGGMTLGFEQAGFDVLAAVELDPVHAGIHKYNFPFSTVLCRDIVQTTGKDIRELSPIGDRDIDVVFGGPPCQGFSLMGKRYLDDARNSLVFHFLRLVLELCPKFFVMENVRGIAVGRQKQFLDNIIQEFQQHNYRVAKPDQILNAADFGVPQNRKRLFLLGCRNNFSLPSYPQAVTQIRGQTKLKLPPTPTVEEAICDLPEANNYPELQNRDWVVADYGKPSEYASKLRHLTDWEDNYAYPREIAHCLLTCSRRTQHTQATIARFAATSPGKTERVSRFPRLALDGLCTTLRAGTARDRGAFTSARPIHPLTPRCITVREAARLHSYPDWFRFHATKWHGFRQIGNSVPPLLAKAIAKKIISSLEVEVNRPTQKYQLGTEELLTFNLYQAAQYFEVDANIIAPRHRT